MHVSPRRPCHRDGAATVADIHPVRVAHVGKFYPPVPGGIERVVESLCAVTKGRLDNRVLAFGTGRRTISEAIDGVPVTRVATWGSAGSVPIAPAFPAHLARVDADVMILHEPNPWALLSYAAVRPRLPLAIWLHSDVVRPALQYQLFYAPIARPAYRAAARFLVASPALADHATALQPFRDRVTVIPYGIDVDRWRPSEEVRRRADEICRRAGRPIVLFAGRHVPYKGVPVLIEAAAPLDVEVVIAGDGPMRESWSARARSQAGAARFSFPGEVDDQELRALFVASRMFVLPSVTPAEAFGYVQLEAMACSTAVISTSVPTGVPWVNETGVVVPPNDVEALRHAIERLVADPELTSRLGALGEARARTNFSMRAMGDRFVAVCRELARTGRHGL
jgi:glycosyltransferase involved in cell wall biosynthesis